MPSRHSGSSHSSSRSSFSSSSSRSSFSSGPSSHSTSSHSSWSNSFSSSRNSNSRNRRNSYNASYNNFRVISRPRYNQPYYNWLWYWTRPRPTIYYCVNHNYTYHPEDWTFGDKKYYAGYYDENGTYYKKKPFIEKKSGRIYTKCPNCETVKDYAYMDFEELEDCPNCGTRMQILNDDDDIFIKEEEYETIWDKVVKVLIYILLGALICGVLYLPYRMLKKFSNAIFTAPQSSVVVEKPKIGSVIYLKKSGNNYRLTTSNSFDKVLEKDLDDNFYDNATGLYLYYSEQFGVWQYWYEPISGNFGDYGWLEHDPDGWWIEVDKDNWIKVPSNFDTSNLWYIEQ